MLHTQTLSSRGSCLSTTGLGWGSIKVCQTSKMASQRKGRRIKRYVKPDMYRKCLLASNHVRKSLEVELNTCRNQEARLSG